MNIASIYARRVVTITCASRRWQLRARMKGAD